MDKEEKKKAPKQKEEPEIEKVVSPKRVIIGTVIGIIITGIMLWSLSQGVQKIIDFSRAPVVIAPQNPSSSVQLPDLQQTPGDLGSLSFDQIFASGSAARNILDTLQNLQQSDTGIEDYFCNFFCNE